MQPRPFEEVVGYPGARVFAGALGSASLIARALGFDSSIQRSALMAALRRRLNAPIPPVPSRESIDHPCVWADDGVDLEQLPTPWWHEADADRYVGTWHLNITQDPETGHRNVGIYRMQILNARQTTVSASPQSHLARHMQRSEIRGQPLDMAVAIGVPEAAIMAGAAAVPFGMDEFAVAGGLQGEPVRLSRCRTVNLDVPSDSEYVIEGRLLPGKRVVDGPYMDYAGFPSTNPRGYLFEVSAVSHREHPIFRGTTVGVPGAEDHQLFAVLADLGLIDFHGSPLRQRLQNFFLRQRAFHLFQLMGGIGHPVQEVAREDRLIPLPR